MTYLVVFVTASSQEEAEKLTQALVENHLAACVNIVPEIRSTYWWKGKIETGQEALLVIKTKRSKLQALIDKVVALHSYTVPEVVAFPIIGGNPAYLKWMNDSLQLEKQHKRKRMVRQSSLLRHAQHGEPGRTTS